MGFNTINKMNKEKLNSFIETTKNIKADFDKMYEEKEDVIDDGLEILQDTFNPSGANSSRKNMDRYGTFIKYSELSDDEEYTLFNYYAIFKGGYSSMICHGGSQAGVWWIKNLLLDCNADLSNDGAIEKNLK